MKNYLLVLTLLISFSVYGQDNTFTIRVHDKTHLKEWNEYSQKHLFSINDNEISKEELELEIKHIKSKEIIHTHTYPKSNIFMIDYDYSKLKIGSYEVKVKTDGFTETTVFSVRDN